ncbi:MAG: hypothetical protein RMY34_11995 [Aulosira sp. DedQUE10]|nr:hypothetical protein [Aulosira sp. DedQUE10]
MQTLQMPQFYVFAETSANQSALIEVNPMEATHNEPKTKDKDIPALVVFLAPICFMIVGAVFLLIISNIIKITHNKNEILNIEYLKEHRCKNCRFFNENNYIKCAVHPSVALTKQALDCSDYKPQ